MCFSYGCRGRRLEEYYAVSVPGKGRVFKAIGIKRHKRVIVPGRTQRVFSVGPKSALLILNSRRRKVTMIGTSMVGRITMGVLGNLNRFGKRGSSRAG